MNQQLITPPGFIIHEFVRDFSYTEEKIVSVWRKLQRRETFTRGQMFPYRVEFAGSSQEGEFFP